jgi:ribose transport system ATP-binding protein
MAVATVELTSVRKTFGPTVALGSCNLKAYAGEVHAIIGGNGSGKSTLAKVISGILIPDSGQVSILGKAATSPIEAKALGVSNVYQEVLVADECSVLDNLYLGSDRLFSSTFSADDKYRRAGALMMELVGFELDLDERVGELPLSLKQWIVIARALLTDPRILILDESSAALDFEATERLFRKMRELKANGASILIVTHRIAELVRIADRATVLRDGFDVGRLEKEEITESRILELIAGPERERSQSGQPVPARQSQAAVMRIEDLKVWPDTARVNLSIYPGEIIGLTGLDGQGQADFVRAVAGVQRPFSGRVALIHGKVSHEIGDLGSARANNISYVSGDRKKEGIFPNLSIFENMLLPVYDEYRLAGALSLVNQTKLKPVFDWEAGKLAVKMGSENNVITSLSGGNQQKVLIARAFAEKPTLLVLNDPARGIDVGAKYDLYRNLKDFVARGNSVIFLSSEIEEFLNLCTRVFVFRNGAISADFGPPYDSHVILNAMFGRRGSAEMPTGDAGDHSLPAHGSSDRLFPFDNGRPVARPLPSASVKATSKIIGIEDFVLFAPDIPAGSIISKRYVEESRISPRLVWRGVPEGTQSFALAVTDPDLPEEFNFPRAFAHWLVVDIPSTTIELAEGASGTALMPTGARELDSDYVTFQIPGFGRGYGGPWPPDRAHRYFFTLYALKASHLTLEADAKLEAFFAAVMPVTIAQASFVALYGPATKPLPS